MNSLPHRALRPFLTHVAGANPSQASLLGSNVYLIGHESTSERIMIDSGDISEKNEGFLSNLSSYLDSSATYISKILLTHGHLDHFGGLNDVCKLLCKRGLKIP